MTLLIFAFIVLLVTALVCYLINSAPIIDSRFKWCLEAIAVVIAILVIVQRAGLVA